MSTAAQILANQANAQRSTGPVTDEGKARSARNNFRHGLASGQLIVHDEDPAAFEALAEALFNEHQPATATEENLVLSMAQHFWLGQRAIRLQNEALADGGNVSQLSLLLRYQTSNQRAYSRCLADLFKLRAERSDEAARLSEPKTSTNEAARLSEPKTSTNEAARLSEPKTSTNEAARLSEPKILINEAVGLGEPNAPIDDATYSNQPQPPTTGFESKIDPRAKKLIQEIREITHRLDQEEGAAA